MDKILEFDAYSPDEISKRVELSGISKARLPVISLVMLGILAGAFIGLGGMLYTLVTSDSSLSFAWSRILGGLSFSLGLILVIVAGAELFTGNNLIVMAWADGKIEAIEVFRNWVIAGLSNFTGALLMVILVRYSGHMELNNGAVTSKYLEIAAVKCSMGFLPAFFSGILCNMLVCLAVWMSFAGRSVTDKAIAIVFPIMAFVAAGFEHSVANMYFIMMGIVLSWTTDVPAPDSITWLGFSSNLVPVIIGNLVGGSVFVAITYYLIYNKGIKKTRSEKD